MFCGLQKNPYICNSFRAKRSPEGHQITENLTCKLVHYEGRKHY